MISVRCFQAGDVPGVAALHSRVFATGLPASDPLYGEYLTRTFLETVEDAVPSLVAVHQDGTIAGFLGVVSRPMVFERRHIRAALSSQFIVAPEQRGSLVAIELLRRFLSGSQELSFTDEANDVAARLWEGLGGVQSPVHSMHWLVPLRPLAMLNEKMTGLGWKRTARALRPLAAAGDFLMNRFLAGRARDRIALRERSLDADRLRAHIADLQPELPLMPAYQDGELHDLLKAAERRQHCGRLQSIALDTTDGRVAGWFVYYAQPGGRTEVLQIVARRGCETDVVGYMLRRALEDGATAAAGRMDHVLYRALAARHVCLMSARRHHMLVHSRWARLQEVASRGLSFPSRLDGEWCIRLR